MNNIPTQDNAKQYENLGDSLLVSITKAGAGDIASDVAEIALDSILEVGLLETIPVFGWLIKGYNVFGAIRDRTFLKKIANFLNGTEDISVLDKEQFLEKIKADPVLSRKVGESLVLLLERHEDFEKSYILGKLFSRYVRGKIEYEVFLRVAKAIEIAFIGDIRNLEKIYKSIEEYDPAQGLQFSHWLDDMTSQSLYSSGLVRAEGYSETIYHSNSTGKELLECLKS
jgi:hypothetical protein